ncbi:MAG: IS1 family transposase [Acidobacteriota bacterium]
MAASICPDCQRKAHRHGTDRKGNQRFKCIPCNKRFTEPAPDPLDGMRIDMKQAGMALLMLVEGNSIRSTERVTEIHRNTILKLLKVAGRKAHAVCDRLLRNLNCDLLQADEIWCYVGAKDKKVRSHHPKEFGSKFVFVAIDSETKLVPSWTVGKRDGKTAYEFLADLAERVSNRPQLSTDGFEAYISAVEDTFGADIDFGQLIKLFGQPADTGRERYSPSGLAAIIKERICGSPDEDLISTSHVERQNLTMRMGMRRFTRLTNAFSKKLEFLKAAVALHFGWYNFCRPHMTLEGCTPAMEAGLTDHVWSIEELLEAA